MKVHMTHLLAFNVLLLPKGLEQLLFISIEPYEIHSISGKKVNKNVSN